MRQRYSTNLGDSGEGDSKSERDDEEAEEKEQSHAVVCEEYDRYMCTMYSTVQYSSLRR